MPELVAMSKYHPPFSFEGGGDLVLYTNAAAAGTFDKSAAFGGTHNVNLSLRIEQVRLTQMDDGTAGTTTIEVFRRRSGVNTLVASVSLASGGGDHSTATTAPASEALRDIQAGDQLLVHFVARQTDGRDVTVEVEFT